MSAKQVQALVKRLQGTVAQQYLGDSNPLSVSNSFSLNHMPMPSNMGDVPDPDDYEATREYWFNRDMQDHSAFLQMVNIESVDHPKGGSITVGSMGRTTMTNDTINGDLRRTNGPKQSKYNEYETQTAHNDFKLHDKQIKRLGAESSKWLENYRGAFFESLANDRIVIGWHGESHEVTSNMTTNPLLQDVNKGWLTLAKERAPQQILTSGKGGAGVLRIGKDKTTCDYANLDHLVQDLYSAIELHHRSPVGTTAMASQALMAMQKSMYYQEYAGQPSEKGEMMRNKLLMSVYGELETMATPFMPQTSLLITPMKRAGNAESNLSIYYLKDSWKRYIEYVPKEEGLVDWNARDEAFHIENLNAIAGMDFDTIEFVDEGKTINRIPTGNFG